MICPIKSGAFRHEESFKSTPGASKYHKRWVFDILLPILTPSGKNDRKYISPTSKDTEFYADFESDVGFCLYCLFDYFLDKVFLVYFRFFFGGRGSLALWSLLSLCLFVPYSFGALARARAPVPWGSAACGASHYICLTGFKHLAFSQSALFWSEV